MPSPFYKNNEYTIVYLNYDESVSKLTGKDNDVFALKFGAPAEELLAHFFSNYPQVFKKAVPGTLIYTINGASVPPFYTLQTGDSVFFKLITLNKLRKDLLQDLESLIKALDVSFSSGELVAFVEEDNSDNPEAMFKKFIQKEDEKKEGIDILEDVMFKVWNSFPRKSFKGKSFSQNLHKELLKEFSEIKFEKDKNKNQN